jgi:chromosome segregation ATPase
MDGRRTGESEQAHIARLNDEIERLRGIINDDRLEGAADEIERLREEVEHLHKMTVKWSVLQVEGSQEIQRLREDRAELVEALIDMRNHINERDWDEDVSNEAKATFAKATGGE